MYLDTMQDVLAASEKILIDVKNGNNVMYLPLDRVRTATPIKANVIPETEATVPPEQETTSRTPVRDTLRERRERPLNALRIPVYATLCCW